jgi:hypothetical protein
MHCGLLGSLPWALWAMAIKTIISKVQKWGMNSPRLDKTDLSCILIIYKAFYDNLANLSLQSL